MSDFHSIAQDELANRIYTHIEDDELLDKSSQ
jgi:hypothetical protein